MSPNDRADTIGTAAPVVQAANMVRLLHFLIVAVYLLLPLAAVTRAMFIRRRDDSAPVRLGAVLVSFVGGTAIALVLCLMYGTALKGHVPAQQILIASYFATALLLLMRCLDIGLLWGLRRATGLHRPGPRGIGRASRGLVVMLARTVILIGVGLPLVLAAIMSYRPKVLPKDNPLTQFGFAYERVEFQTSDGVRLVGWWIPAGDSRHARRWESAGRETVLLCHGMFAAKANHLILARRLVPAGFNVLAIDFRAHGESGGQLTGYGALEKQDVLAAVRWVRESHARESEKVFGVGASTGAVALLAAAVDDSSDGRSICAVAAYGAYDDLPDLVRDAPGESFHRPLGLLLQRVAIPIAGAHVGTNLSACSPKRLVTRLWPRPILFIHGQMDEVIPFERGEALFDAATQPKSRMWISQGDHDDVLRDDDAAKAVVEFFKFARPVPVI